MKNIKRVVALACTLALTGGIFAGCAKKTTEQPAGEQPAATNKPVTIAFWEQDDPNAQKVLDELIKEFQGKHNHITVKRTHQETEDLRKNYTSASLGKTGPDIVLGPNDNLGVFVPGGLVVPASDIMGDDFFKTLDQNSLAAAKYNGKQYMIPDRNGNELILIYNKKLVPEAPKTFEELIEISKKLQAEKKVQYGLVFNIVEPFFTIPFLGAFGGKVFDDVNAAKPQVTLDTPAVKEWMTFLKNLHNEKVIPKEADYDVAHNLFKEEKAAFIINGPWSFGDYQQAKMDFGIATIPTINGKYPAPYSAVKGYTISASVANDKDKKEAVKLFLAFLNSKEAQLKMVDAHNQMPTNVEAIKDGKIQNNPLIAGQKDQLDKATPMPIITQMRAVWDGIKPIQQEVFAGKTKPEEAGAKMQKKAEEGIKALGF
jgi:arabinogalactan oligomer / maltooligosaccharide transport system substrate-binding protein